jgi:predicted GNAT family acetyltransferase
MDRSTQAGLDRPIWSALTTRHAQLAQGNELARRYHPDVAPFAAVASETSAAYQALHQFLQSHEQVVSQTVDPIGPIEGFQMTHRGMIHQMVATRHKSANTDDQGVIQLSNADAKNMLALAERVKLRAFGTRTCEMGNYIGIRDQGRLIAMAGERVRLDGYAEVSAVCVDEDWRGRGLGSRLVNVLRREIERRGETPFLHVFSNNRLGIELYEHLGFELRQTFHLTRIYHADPAPATDL